MDLGFLRAGFEPIWANDVDADAIRTYEGAVRTHGVYPHAVHGDIRRQDLPGRDAAPVVVGGPPCQGFSVAGRMDPNDPRSRHVFDFLGVVKRVRPQAFVMENVMGLAQNRRWEGIRGELFQRARSLGYQTQLVTLNASHFGVPQNRQRMFLIGFLDAQPNLEIIATSAGRPPTVRGALADLPAYGTPGNATKCTARVTPARNPILRRSPFAGMLFNGQGRPLNLDVPAPTLPASMGGNRTPIIDQVQLDEGGEHWVVGYHQRLMSGGKPVVRIPSRLRRITLEEAAAIQTFPRGLEWHGRLSSQFKQIGNAVPPSLAFHVAQAVRRALGFGEEPIAEEATQIMSRAA